MLQELNEYCSRKGIGFRYGGIPEQSNAFRDRYPSWLNDSSYRDDSLRTEDVYKRQVRHRGRA